MAKKKAAKKAVKNAAKPVAAPTGAEQATPVAGPTTPNPSRVDSTGKTFDAELHESHSDGKPQMDQQGRFIHKGHHPLAPKGAPLDSFRHKQ